jgi:hypothetical protein
MTRIEDLTPTELWEAKERYRDLRVMPPWSKRAGGFVRETGHWDTRAILRNNSAGAVGADDMRSKDLRLLSEGYKLAKPMLKNCTTCKHCPELSHTFCSGDPSVVDCWDIRTIGALRWPTDCPETADLCPSHQWRELKELVG